MTDLVDPGSDGLPRSCNRCRRGPPRGRRTVPEHPALAPDPARFDAGVAEFSERMAGNYPYHDPRYAGQMLKPPHPVAVAAYTAAMHINTNNHALDGGPATCEMEVEVVARAGRDVRLPGRRLGHLTSSGTIANLEALWVARELHPGKAIVSGTNAHYTHSRMWAVLGVEATPRPDRPRRAEAARRSASGRSWSPPGRPASARWTTSGAIALRESTASRARRRGLRRVLHAARRARAGGAVPSDRRRRQRRRRPAQDGLQPYGCGAVLFRDPGVGASTSTTRPTRTSPPPSCTWVRSASSARARERRRRRCG